MLNASDRLHETILVVDDCEFLLASVVEFLRLANFNVLSSHSGSSAIKLAGETHGRIDLLLSDVDMRDMSGPDLGEELKKVRPDMHVMLMSGGTDGNLLVLNYGWAFIKKPFVPSKLVEMIKHVLHSQNRSQPGGQKFDSSSRVMSIKNKDDNAHPSNSNEPNDRGEE